MSQHPPILIVNEADEPIGSASMDEAHKQGFIHRIVYLMVENPQGEVLLQKRGPTMATYPNCWDVSAAGQVDEGEDYDTAAKRELSEELGLKNVELQEIGSYRSNDVFQGRQLNRFNRVYRAVIPKDRPLQLQTSELAGTDWFGVAQIKELIKQHPDEVASGLVGAIKRFYL